MNKNIKRNIRTMLKITKNNETITINTITKDNDNNKIKHSGFYNYSGFYITKTDIKRLFKLKSIVVKDIYNICDISINTDKNIIIFDFFWLDRNYDLNLKGQQQIITIDLNTFKNWFLYSDSNKITILDKIEKPVIKMEINSNNNFKAAIKDKTTKKILVKKLMQLMQNYYDDKIIIYDDYIDKSFYFTRYRDNTFTGNGGIILHTDSDGKKYYGIHT